MIEKVIKISEDAGKQVMEYWGSEYDKKSKGKGYWDVVTSADLASEKLITKRLREEFPDDKIISEEHPRRPDS